MLSPIYILISLSSPPRNPLRVMKETRFTTPPGSPDLKPRGLISPKKVARAPATPHHPSMDAFWQQDVINDWNDEYSPRKTPAPRLLSPAKAKLSPVKPDKAAKEAKKAFEEKKHELATSFLAELDTTITNGQVSALAESTGGIKIVWSNKLNTTAGRANWKREAIRSLSTSLPSHNSTSTSTHPTTTGITYRHHATIELASKVISSEERLLNVLAHEFCHLANFMISNIKTNPHGKEFKAWAAKVTHRFGHRGIEVTTKHSYEIDYKFVWECSSCGVLYKRHSRSIDPARHQCGTCKGKLVQVRPVPRGGGPVFSSAGAAARDAATGNGAAGAGAEKKGLSEYQLFVKENMKIIKQANPGSPQKEIMGLVGKKYREFKADKAKHSEGSCKSEVLVENEVDDIEDESEDRSGDGLVDDDDDALGGVVRKLDFLDLTADSPPR